VRRRLWPPPSPPDANKELTRLSTVLLILVALVVLVGLITIIMSIKNWHWAQMLLLLGVFLFSIVDLILGMEVYRIHRTFGKPIPNLEKQIAEQQNKLDAIQRGTRDQAAADRAFAPKELPFDWDKEGRMPPMEVWKQRLQVQARDRGRVWVNVTPTGFDPKQGQVAVTIPAPKPHGLEKEAIVYAFEQIPPGSAPAPPGQGPQYIGEFRVFNADANGAILQSVPGLDERTQARVVNSVRSRRPWKLYETMPPDSHELFTGLSPEQLKQMLPASTVNEYIRQGTPATPDDDENHRAPYDESGHRLGPEDAAKAAKVLYDRPLRDYAYLFTDYQRERSEMLAQLAGLRQDIERLKAAQANGEQLKAYRQKEIAALTDDLKFMKRDREVVEKLLATIQGQLANARKLVSDLIQQNAEHAQKLVASQLEQLRSLTSAPAPARNAVNPQ
jgi:hypothetical protein